MTREEHLRTIAMEECAELAQRLSKENRFGHMETQPGVDDDGTLYLPNAFRTTGEYADLIATMEMIGYDARTIFRDVIEAKKAKVEKYLRYSKEKGTLV